MMMAKVADWETVANAIRQNAEEIKKRFALKKDLVNNNLESVISEEELKSLFDDETVRIYEERHNG